MPAYKLNVNQHIKTLTSKQAYIAFIEYWNDKVQQKELYNKGAINVNSLNKETIDSRRRLSSATYAK